MKKLRILLGALLATLIGVGAMATKSSLEMMESPELVNTQQEVEWYYLGPDDPNEYTEMDNWIREDQGSPATDCGDGTDIPCTLLGPANPTSFEAKLNTLGSTGIDNDAIQHRPAVNSFPLFSN